MSFEHLSIIVYINVIGAIIIGIILWVINVNNDDDDDDGTV